MRKSKIYLAVVIMTIMTGVCGCNFIGKWNINNREGGKNRSASTSYAYGGRITDTRRV